MPRAPAHLLAGGLLREQVDEVVGAFAERLGMHERERRERGEWAVVWLIRGRGSTAVEQLGGGAYARAVDQIDRRAHAILALELEQSAGGA